MTESSREIGLGGKVESERNIDQRAISSRQQLFGALQTLRADVLMGRSTHGRFEGACEMKPAQAGNRCQLIKREITFQVSVDILQDTRQPSSIKTLLRNQRPGLRR